jgi:hypothetical protein
MLKACIVRRTPRSSWISSEALLKALQEDNDLVRTKTPQYYFSDALMNLSQELDLVVEEELILRSGKGGRQYQRTKLGDIFLKAMEPKLASVLDEMPMTGEDLLDFLSML